jgi:hypothetical protein
MIFHIWPLVGIVLVVQAMKKRAQKEEQDCSETASAEPEAPAPAVDNGE